MTEVATQNAKDNNDNIQRLIKTNYIHTLQSLLLTNVWVVLECEIRLRTKN